METWQTINSVRVIREFADRPLAAGHIERILNAARRAGSSKNEQHWAFIVIRDRERLLALATVGRYAGHLAGAAAAVALISPEPSTTSHTWDLGRAAQNMVLAAWELGVGSVPATVYDHELAHRLLGIPSDRRCDYLLSFGYPADPPLLSAPNRSGGRLALADLIHEERW